MKLTKQNMPDEGYLATKKIAILPYVPLEGNIDLTYRCNNNCRHCWVRISPESSEKNNELSLEQIKKIVEEAKGMGCRRWAISGGEPMLRPDFLDIFDYISRNSNSYSINTNGTLITPKIAKLMKRKGTKMIALYGATTEVHDYITRNPGSFDAVLRGFRYLKEAGAGFIVQIVPMRDNYHQFKDMATLAESLSKHYRLGAAWLYMSACGDQKINKEIQRQRLDPKDVVDLDKPDLSYEEWIENDAGCDHCNIGDGKYLFSACIKTKRDFHIDPYGKTTFCCFLKHPEFRYDLRKGNFKDCWEEFIPSLAKKVKVTEEYNKNCGSCNLRKECRFCPVYAYLEHGRFGAKINYLCEVAKENRNFKENWRKKHRRYFRIADITIQVESDLPIKEDTFHHKFKHFEAADPVEGMIHIRHHFSLPDLNGEDLGKEVYRKPPWAIYQKGDSWIYLGISPIQSDRSLHRVVTFNSDHTRANIYNDKKEIFLKGGLQSLTLFPSDQLLLARILADREGFYLHSCGVNLQGRGLLFAGHSESGKSTMATLLQGKAEILCDDRMIVRKTTTDNRKPNNDFKIYGTWSHGDVPDISSTPTPLRAIMFLEKSDENRIIPLDDKKEITKRLLSCLIKPFVTSDWWEKTLLVVDKVVKAVPCYILRFDKSGKVVDILSKL
jgi:MoaA/NifB/PqqE/SkfB family radical SAM enzyme